MPRGNGGIIGPVNTSFSGVWSLTEAQLRRSANTWPNFYTSSLSESATGSDAFTVGAAADEYFEYTTLLLPGSGTNGAQNNTFLDGSTNNFTITRNGNTTQGTFSPFSQTGWGNYFGGGASNINLPSSTDFALGGAFSFECWVYQTSIPNQVDLLDVRTSNEVGSLGISSTGFPRWQNGPTTGSLITGSTALTANQWNYLLFVADASGCSIYLNGTRGVNTSQVATWPTSARPCFIAGSFGNASGGSLNGYVSDVRLIKGSTPYSSTATTVTVPTGFLPFVTNTVLQCCKSNRFVNTVSGTSMTTNGTTSVQAFSPFNPTASWSAATYGGSGYFDGSGDYLSLASTTALQFGTGDFAIEGWYYFNSVSSGVLVDFRSDGTGFDFYLSSGTLNLSTSGTYYGGTSGITLVTGQWYYIVLTRSGTAWRIFVNGTAYANITNSTNFTATILRVGYGAGGTYFNGYLSSARILKGTGYSSITVPTSPLTAITNTSLLLNFTNAGIYDATSKNDLETVGNAQISTTQSKFGGSSMYFDGTGDYLYGPSNNLVNFGTGAFTIEGWVYALATPSDAGFFTNGGAATGSLGFYFLTGYLRFDIYGGGGFAATTLLPLNQWVHIACVRSGNTVTLYQNGTSVGSSTITDNNTSSLCYVGTKGWDLTKVFNGYMQDVRITKGYARYTGNFTAPTAAFPTL